MKPSLARRRLFLALWLSGLPGIAAVAWMAVPILIEGRNLSLPIWAVQAASALQSALLLAAAVAIGTALAHRVNLSAPVFSALAERRPVFEPLRVQFGPSAVGSLLGGAILWALQQFTPAQILEAAERSPSIPPIARVLYGGITEELLLRWGLMTFILWVLWRFIQKGVGVPSSKLACTAIVSSAVLFGMGHLPAASALVGNLTTESIVYILGANASFGIIAGWLFWRGGLECAIMAHAGTHLLLLWTAR